MAAAPSPGQPAGDPGSVEDVLRFWLDDVGPQGWFRRDAEADAAIGERFGKLLAERAALPAEAALASPRQLLATLIVLDQFSRNMHRDSPAAFASDPLARAIARLAVERGLDREVPLEVRHFVYLPFEHSEDLADQETSVRLITKLGDDTYTRYAKAHRDVIARFGRFPHRNAALGRASTPAEVTFLQQPASSSRPAASKSAVRQRRRLIPIK